MTAYEALLCEITAIHAARDALPQDSHLGGLFDLTLCRLSELVDTMDRPKSRGLGVALPFDAVLDSAARTLALAS